MIEKPETELPDFGEFVASAAAAGKLPTMAEVVAWFEAASEYDPWLRSAVCGGLRHVLASYEARPQPLDAERQRLRDWAQVRLAQLDDGP